MNGMDGAHKEAMRNIIEEQRRRDGDTVMEIVKKKEAKIARKKKLKDWIKRARPLCSPMGENRKFSPISFLNL